MPFVERDHHRIYYATFGRDDAPPLLLVMGLALTSSAWDKLPKRLAERYRVIVFDNRGMGESTAPRGFFRIRDLADDAASVLDAVGVRSAGVFGISMGGMIALELTLRHPERVRALALGATFAGYLRARKPRVRTVAELALATLFPGKFAVRRLARLLVSDAHYAKDPRAFTSWLTSRPRAHPRMVARQMAAIAFHATESRLAGIAVPTLVLTGDRDRLVPAENSRRLARLIPNAKLVELPGVGHVFPHEREDETVRALTDWFG